MTKLRQFVKRWAAAPIHASVLALNMRGRRSMPAVHWTERVAAKTVQYLTCALARWAASNRPEHTDMASKSDRAVLEIAPEITPEMEAVIGFGLSEYNRLKAGYVDHRDLPVILRDGPTGKILGGLLGRTTFGLLFIDLVYLPEEARGQGVGTSMLEMAENQAIARGCTAAVLFTIVFQAPDFYRRHGYRELGRVDVAAPGASRVCMTKQLVSRT